MKRSGLFLALGILAGCASSPGGPTAPVTTHGMPVTGGGRVTYSVTLHHGQCHARGVLPDPRCTPGGTDPEVTQATIRTTICTRGWTARVRPPAADTDSAKYQVAYPAYGIPAGTAGELDHLIPLELGGSSDITNLWPEPGPVPNAKDAVENDLRADVCAGELSLAAARQAIAANWQTVP